jgi:hypothetical protein
MVIASAIGGIQRFIAIFDPVYPNPGAGSVPETDDGVCG